MRTSPTRLSDARVRALLPALVLPALLACVPKLTPPLRLDPLEAEYRQRIRAGDEAFDLDHLVGWREALENYRLAFGLRASEAARERLMLTSFLVLLRETEEGIRRPDQSQALAKICSGSRSEIQKRRCRVAGSGFSRAEDDGPLLLAAGWPDQEGLRRYLDLALRPSDEPAGEGLLREYVERFSGTTLATYISLQEGFWIDSEKQPAFPRFAERFAYRGETYLALRDYRNAIRELKKAADLVPDYRKVHNMLGNLYLFGLYNYEAAQESFESVLQLDNRDPVALFGKGVCLFSRSELAPAHQVLDDLVLDPSVRWSDLEEERERYYRGQSRYYKANLHHLLGEPEEARRWVNEALSYLPRDQGARYLSGVLYWEGEDRVQAARVFQSLARDGTRICDAYYRLGVLSGQSGQRRADHFLASAYCIEQNLDAAERELEASAGLGLSQDDAANLRRRLQAQIDEIKASGRTALGAMLSILEAMKSPSFQSQTLALESTLDRLGSL